MKIAFVVPMLAPYAIPRFKELAKIKDVEVHVIVEKAISNDRIGWKYDSIDGVTTHLIKNGYSHEYVKLNKNGNYTQNDEHRFSFELRNVINSIKPDIVLVCNSSQLLMLLGPRNYKLGVIVEDTLRADEGRKTVSRFIKKSLLKTADFYCAFSPDSVEFLNAYGIKGTIINTSWSVDISDFSNMTKDDITKFKIEHEIDDNKKNYIIIANLIKLKGIIEFLRSWSKLPNDIRFGSELFIAGDGPLKEEILLFINDNDLRNIRLLGHVDYNDIKRYLQSVDIFVLPTLQDLNSLSVYEAIAARKPLLVSKYNGSRFLVKEDENGYIFDPLNENDTVNKVSKMYSLDLTMMSKVSENISKLYTNKYVMEEFAKDLYKVYRGC